MAPVEWNAWGAWSHAKDCAQSPAKTACPVRRVGKVERPGGREGAKVLREPNCRLLRESERAVGGLFFCADSVGFAILANEYVDPTGSVDLER